MPAITCAICGTEANRCGSQALYCIKCALTARPRIAAAGRQRNCNMKPMRLDGRWCCVECRSPVKQGVYGGKKVRPPVRCMPCARRRIAERNAVSGRAHGVVAKAIKSGALPHPAKLRCADCDRPACQYDHRDYTKPLDVAPVCRSCNVMRGSADVWALPGQLATPAKASA